MLHSLTDLLRAPLAFVVVLGVLVFVHEFGHYLAARWQGVHVEAFSIGFGRALASWTDRRGTVWKVALIPLGGYVKLHGLEQLADVPEEVQAGWQKGRTFHDKPLRARAIVIAAGPLANFLLAAVLFSLLFVAFGRGVVAPVVGEVLPHSAASAGGMENGDRVVAINGVAITEFEQIRRAVAVSPGRPLTLIVRRKGVDHTLQVTPETVVIDGRKIGILGVRGRAIEYQRLSPWQAVPAGIAETLEVTRQTLVALWGMVAHHAGTSELSGPLGIAQLSGQVAALGFASLLSFVAVLSANLGLFNLLPIPVLDGGHLLFYAAEAVLGRPLPPRAQEYGFRLGLALLACLFFFATWNDLVRIGLFHWVHGLLG
jgi:regulator of sigma E protease